MCEQNSKQKSYDLECGRSLKQEFFFQRSLKPVVSPCGGVVMIILLSVPERALICFRLSFLATAALWSPLNISLIIRRFQTIFGSYIP